MLGIQTHTHVHTHGHTPPPCPPFSFLRFPSFVGLSLRLFRWLLRLVSLPQSRAKYSLFSFLHLSFSLALLALLFLSFFLSFLRLFRYLFRFLTRAPPSGPARVCVCVCVCQTLSQRVLSLTWFCRGIRLPVTNLIQRSWVTGREVVEDAQPCTCRVLHKLLPSFSAF